MNTNTKLGSLLNDKPKLVNKYEKLIDKGLFTQTEINSIRKAINGSSHLPREWKKHIVDSFYNKAPFKITKEQSLKGINYLKNHCFKLNGEVRKSCIFQNRELDIIRNFKKFEFVGLYNISTNAYDQYLPIYRVIDKKGNFFDYYAGMWGNMEVVG